MRPQLLLLSLVVSLTFAILGCEKPDDITQIRAVVDTAVDAAKRHDINDVMEFVTNDFSVHPGDRDEQAARSIMLIALRRYGKFDIKYPVPAIELSDDSKTAKVSVPFLIVRENADFPDVTDVRDDPARWLEGVGDKLGDPYRLKMDFTKASGEWKVRKATLQGSRSMGGRYR